MKQQNIPKRNVVALLNTHAHFDHSGHIPDLINRYAVEWHLHPDDTFLQTLATSSAQRYGFEVPEPAVADVDLVPNEILEVGALGFEILHTPGHTLGGCCLRLIVTDGPDHLFVGDTLFAGSVGRTDLPNTGGDFTVLARSIHTQLWPLAPETIVYPGHGPLTTIGHEKKTNPFVGDDSGSGGVYTRGRYA
jgi:glyoxylase-like metal-dependent hydrolase (beta-lactamase superfamily II)